MLSNKKGIFNVRLFVLIVALAVSGCKPRNVAKHNGTKDLISFKSIEGINYTEVARKLKNGLIFNEYGYQLQPEWQMSFISDDSTRIYSPIKKQLINFPLSRGYDSIFNTARTWLKVKKMNKDSMVLEILKSQGDSLEVGGAQVYMLFYSDNYVKNVLHTDTSVLRHPSRKDTAYIRSLIAKSEKDIANAFAARHPVQLISKSRLIKAVQRTTLPDFENHFDTSDDYLEPTFDIVINKAYRDFYYSVSVYVDAKGEIHFRIPLTAFTEEGYKEQYIRESMEIINTYLKAYIKVVPGTTLGIPHASIISLHITGKTAAAAATEKK